MNTQPEIADTPEEFEDLQRASPNGVVNELLGIGDEDTDEDFANRFAVEIHPARPVLARRDDNALDFQKAREQVVALQVRVRMLTLLEERARQEVKKLSRPLIRNRPFTCEHLDRHSGVVSCIHVMDQQVKPHELNRGGFMSQYVGLMLCGAQTHLVSDLLVVCVECATQKYGG